MPQRYVGVALPQIKKCIHVYFTQECIGRMKRSVKEKGIQNKIMEKVYVYMHSLHDGSMTVVFGFQEIILHCRKAATMRESIEDLQVQIRYR